MKEITGLCYIWGNIFFKKDIVSMHHLRDTITVSLSNGHVFSIKCPEGSAKELCVDIMINVLEQINGIKQKFQSQSELCALCNLTTNQLESMGAIYKRLTSTYANNFGWHFTDGSIGFYVDNIWRVYE